MKCRGFIALFIVASACGDNVESGATLEVTTPARGTVEAESDLVVAGSAAADGRGLARVEVNGKSAEINRTTGTFTITLDLPLGTQLIETVAIARDGGRARDVRAVSVGAFAGDDAVFAARMMQIGNDRLGLVGDEIEATIDNGVIATEIMTGLVKDEGTEGGCDRDAVSVTSVSAPAGVALFGAGAGFRGETTYNPYQWTFSAEYSDSTCALVTGTFSFDTEELHVDYTINVSNDEGPAVEILNPATVYHHPFFLDEGTLEPAVAARVTDGITVDIANAVMTSSLPRIKARTDAWLNAQASDETTTVAGVEVRTVLVPQAAGNGRGMTLSFSSALSAAGLSPSYVATPEDEPLLSSRFASVAISDDEVNQLLGLLWRTGAFDTTIDGISLELLVPPFLSATEDGAEIFVAGWSASEGEAAMTVSARIPVLSGRTDSHLFLEAGEALVVADPVEGEIDDIQERLAAAVSQTLTQALRALSLPAAKFAWAAVEATPAAGYVVVDTAQ